MVRWSEGELQIIQARQKGQAKPQKLGRSRARTASGRVEQVERHGMVFDSKREADRWDELRLREKAGEISSLVHHRLFPIVVNDHLICQYEADFTYIDVKSGKRVIEDAKGHRTEMYRLKKKLMRACYDAEIVEV